MQMNRLNTRIHHKSSLIITDPISHRGSNTASTRAGNHGLFIQASASLRFHKHLVQWLLPLWLKLSQGAICVADLWNQCKCGRSQKKKKIKKISILSSSWGSVSSPLYWSPVSHTIWLLHLDPGKNQEGGCHGVCVCIYQVKSDIVYPIWHPASSLGMASTQQEWAKLSCLHSYRATGRRSQPLYKINSHTHKRRCHSNMRLETKRYLFGIQASSWGIGARLHTSMPEK